MTMLMGGFGAATQSNAQTLSQDITVEMFPANPGPGERTILSASSINIDLTRTEIVWSTDGKVANRGTGMTTFTLNAPVVGKEVRVDVSAKTTTGTIIKTFTIRPAGVEILWHSHGHAPPLYPGKILHTSETLITATAMPHFILRGVPLSAASLFYEWRVQDKPLTGQSGLGKQTITFKGSMLFSKDVLHVEVSTKDKTLIGESTVTINTVPPQIVFYEDDPLSGTRYEQALSGSYFLSKPELTVRAEPYFFSKQELESAEASQVWTINGSVLASDPEFSRAVTLRQTGGSGEATLSYAITASRAALQEARKTFTIFFGQSQ